MSLKAQSYYGVPELLFVFLFVSELLVPVPWFWLLVEPPAPVASPWRAEFFRLSDMITLSALPDFWT